MSYRKTITMCMFIVGLVSACATNSAATDAGESGSDSSGKPSEESGDPDAESGSENQAACERYGGPSEVATVVAEYIVPELLGDCRVSSMFTSLPEPAQQHLVECLTIQVQELFGCEDARYAGATDSMGAMCRDMVNAHTGLGITNGDFDAVIEDIVAGLVAAGIAQGDIDAVAPTVLSTRAAIVEVESDELSNSACAGG